MKKLAILAAFMIAPMLVLAQGVFDSYEGEADVTTVVVTKNMFKLLAQVEVENDDPDVQEYMSMVEGLESIKVFITDNESVGNRMKADVTRYVASSKGLDELMRIQKDDANVKFYSKQGSNESTITELLLFVEGEMEGKKGAVIASITGTIDLKHLSRLTKDLSLPASDFAVSPNPATDQITIKSKDQPITSIIIFDSTGKKVFSEENLNATSRQVSIASFAKGMYLVSVNNQMSQKILKK